MKLHHAYGIVAASLVFLPWACLAQAAPNTQQQIDGHNRKVQEYLREKRPDLAIPELRALVALDPENADAHGNLGVLLFFTGDCTGALPELRAATSRQSGLWRIEVLQAVCEQRAGDVPAARADLEDAFPHLDDKKLRLQAGMGLIDLYAGTGDVAKAVPVVQTLREDDPTNLAVLDAAYRIYSDLAAETMLSIAVVDPDSAEAHGVMARESLRYGDPGGAVEQYRAAIKINPHLSGVHLELAEVLSDSLNPADKKEAESEYRLALRQNPSDERAVYRIAEIDQANNRTQQAFDGYSRAIKLAPGDIDARLGLAELLIEMNRKDEAQSALEQVVQMEPENATAHYLLCKLDWKLGRKDDARRELDLYKKYKDMREKLQQVYRIMRVTPLKIRAGDRDETGDPEQK